MDGKWARTGGYPTCVFRCGRHFRRERSGPSLRQTAHVPRTGPNRPGGGPRASRWRRHDGLREQEHGDGRAALGPTSVRIERTYALLNASPFQMTGDRRERAELYAGTPGAVPDSGQTACPGDTAVHYTIAIKRRIEATHEGHGDLRRLPCRADERSLVQRHRRGREGVLGRALRRRRPGWPARRGLRLAARLRLLTPVLSTSGREHVAASEVHASSTRRRHSG